MWNSNQIKAKLGSKSRRRWWRSEVDLGGRRVGGFVSPCCKVPARSARHETVSVLYNVQCCINIIYYGARTQSIKTFNAIGTYALAIFVGFGETRTTEMHDVLYVLFNPRCLDNNRNDNHLQPRLQSYHSPSIRRHSLNTLSALAILVTIITINNGSLRISRKVSGICDRLD